MNLINKKITQKVNETKKSEKDYRKIKTALSYSSLKLYDTDRKLFYQEFILGESKTETKSDTLILGDLIHSLIAETRFDDKFTIPGVIKPTGQMGDLCENVYERSLKSLYNGVQQDTFATIFSEGFLKTKYNWKGEEIAFKKKEEETVKEIFLKEGLLYYDELVFNTGKILISQNQYTQAENIVNRLKEHPYTADYININNEMSDGIEVFNELPIEFEIAGIMFKAMVDKIIINHVTKTIEPLDFKTTYDVESVEYSYLKYQYYIQAVIYDRAIKEFCKLHDVDHYTVHPMKFIFIDSKNFDAPVILHLSEKDLCIAWDNFKIEGKQYTGVSTLINNICWSISTGDWTQNESTAKVKGILQLNLNYDRTIK